MEFGLVVPAVVLSLRTVDLKWPRLEGAMWAFLALEVTIPLWTPLITSGVNTVFSLVFHASNAALLLTGVGIILYAVKRPLGWPVRVEVLALLAMAGLMLHEAARIPGWVPIENPVLRLFHVPIMLLAIGAAIYERHVASIWRMERANFDLERRVADKTREIEAAHASVEEANRARALAQERQRILGDMHDGVGASLVGLLRYVQSGNTDPQDLERRVRGALQEMRIAVDALEPADGDLGAVLGKLRYRLEPLVDASGARFVWDVAPLPRVEALEPASVFAIQRIVLEAIANVLNHSGAREIRVSVRDQATRGIEVRIEDDGKGFDASAATSGLGLRNMRSRAERLGAELLVDSSSGKGTCVRLLVPYQLPTRSNDPPVAPTSAAVPELTVLVPSAG
jgi:signal transduction histidine kinase